MTNTRNYSNQMKEFSSKISVLVWHWLRLGFEFEATEFFSLRNKFPNAFLREKIRFHAEKFLLSFFKSYFCLSLTVDPFLTKNFYFTTQIQHEDLF